MKDDTPPKPSQDFAHTLLFLEFIDAHPDRLWYFRCIHPLTGKAKKVTGVVHGAEGMRTLKKLAALNDEGWGVFVVVNHGGSRNEDIDRIDVLYLDFDKKDDGHLAKLAASAVPMSLIVESSPDKHHGYLFPNALAALTREEADDWTRVLLAHFGSDNLHDAARVMRVPGFFHTKDPAVRFMTRMILPDGDLPEYSREVLSAWVEGLRAGLSKDITLSSSKVVRIDGAEVASRLPANANNAQIADEMCSPEGPLHTNLVKLMGRMKADKVPPEKIQAFFTTLVPRIAASRGEERARVYAEKEVESVFLHCIAQERKHEERHAAQIAENLELETVHGMGSTEVLSVEDMQKRFVFIEIGSLVFDPLHPRKLLTFQEFSNATCANTTWVVDQQGRGRTVPNATLWMRSGKLRKSVDSVTFKAGGDPYESDLNGLRCVNTWLGWMTPSVEGDATPFFDHIRLLFKDRAEDFFDWAAHIIQFPGEMNHKAWLHISTRQGTGRNWLASVLLRVMHGNMTANVDLPALLGGGYNGRLSQMCLAVVDELREGGSERWSHLERFKQLITQSTIEINPKYGRQRIEWNACRWLLFSNHRSALTIDEGDRRFEVVLYDEYPQSPDYFVRLYGLLKDDAFIHAVMYALRNRDLKNYNCGDPAKYTAAKANLVESYQKDDFLKLKEATETWDSDIALIEDLAAIAETVLDKHTRKAFSYTLESAGWGFLDRWRIDGVLRTVYCKHGTFDAWTGKSGHEIKLGLRWDERVKRGAGLKVVK